MTASRIKQTDSQTRNATSSTDSKSQNPARDPDNDGVAEEACNETNEEEEKCWLVSHHFFCCSGLPALMKKTRRFHELLVILLFSGHVVQTRPSPSRLSDGLGNATEIRTRTQSTIGRRSSRRSVDWARRTRTKKKNVDCFCFLFFLLDHHRFNILQLLLPEFALMPPFIVWSYWNSSFSSPRLSFSLMLAFILLLLIIINDHHHDLSIRSSSDPSGFTSINRFSQFLIMGGSAFR